MQRDYTVLARPALVGGGTALLLVGLMLTDVAAYATPPFVMGLLLDLTGLLLLSGAVSIARVPMLSGLRRHRTLQPQRERRPVCFRRSVQFVRLLGAIVVLGVFAIGAVFSVPRLSALEALKRSGRIVDAVIISKQPVSELRGAPTGQVYYSFRVENRTVSGHFKASREDYPRLGTGGILPVTYLPGKPYVHLLGVLDTGSWVRHLCSILLLLSIGMVGLIAPILSIEMALRAQLSLARAGEAITGTIVGCTPCQRRGRCVGYQVRYEFALPSGVRLGGRARIPYLRGEPTLVGFPITVLVDPVHTWRHAPLAALTRVRFTGIAQSVLAS